MQLKQFIAKSTIYVKGARKLIPLLSALISALAFAQSATELAADQLLRQQQRERAESNLLNKPLPDIRLPRETTSAPVTTSVNQADIPCFPISHLSLTGENASRFTWALHAANGLLNTCIGSRGVNAVITAVQNAVISAGYVTTRIVIAPQDMSRGELVLTVVPGRIRTIRFAESQNSRQWLGPTYISTLPTRAGEILNLRDIEQALENFKRIPTEEADIQITPGDQPGESDLVIQWHQSSPFRLNLGFDDSGTDATGKHQANATLSLDNPLGIQDLFALNVSHDLQNQGNGGGTRNVAVSYSLPLGYWLLSATGSRYRYYQSVAGATQNYVYSGTSANADLKLSRIIYRDATRKINASVRGYMRSSRNFIDDTELEVQHRRMGGFEYAISDKEFIGQATLEGTLSYKRGTGAFGTLPAPEEQFGEGTSRPKIINTDVELSLPFSLGSQRFQYQGSWRAQWNRTPLILQDQFSIGGRYTVRGFDGDSTLVAERGRLFRNDIGLNIEGWQQQPYLGVDYGEVSGPNTRQLLGTRLMGAVIGLRGQQGQLQYDFFIGCPLKKPAGFSTAPVTGGFSIAYAI